MRFAFSNVSPSTGARRSWNLQGPVILTRLDTHFNIKLQEVILARKKNQNKKRHNKYIRGEHCWRSPTLTERKVTFTGAERK